MKKTTILKHKLIRAYHNPENWKYSIFKGYPIDTFFGYKSLNDLIKDTTIRYRNFYGNTLRKWRYN